MDWTVASGAVWTKFALAGLLAAGFIGAVWLIFRRSRSISRDAEKLIKLLRKSDPDLATVLEAVIQNGDFHKLLEGREANEAFLQLRNQIRTARKQDARTALLTLTHSSSPSRTAAPGIRLVRAIYLNSEVRERLPQSADQAADRLLDALTG